MTYQSDLDHCKDAIRHGSLSFHAASRVLPKSVRDPALALYAFCRVADDEVDLKPDKITAVKDLIDRIDRVYSGTPRNHPTDRAFAHMVEKTQMPRALPEALLEGLAWDAQGRQYDSLGDLYSYSARVASAVGAMMCVIMGARDRHVLARACDLGVAMQLTNIARDVGEDALEGRLYLPQNWFADMGIDPDDFIANPTPRQPIRRMVQMLLSDAERLYIRAQAGIAHLPLSARGGIYAARFIYAGIGENIRAFDHDSITRRARTSRGRKLSLLGKSVMCTAFSTIGPPCAMLYAQPLAETAFLVEAAANPEHPSRRWSDRFCQIMIDLKAQEQFRQTS